MTDEQANVAIAEACGWQEIWMDDRGNLRGFHWNHAADGKRRLVPDHLNDLNAIHEAVMAQPQEVRDKINIALMNQLDPQAPWVMDRTINATARQRAEAFLRIVGKWVEP